MSFMLKIIDAFRTRHIYILAFNHNDTFDMV